MSEVITKPRRVPLEVVFVERPRCPHCGGCQIKTRHSRTSTDDSVKRYVTCKACEKNFIIILD